MIQVNLLNKEVKTNGICDNVDCENPIRATKEVRMKDEFEGGLVNWCDDCIERDKDFIQMCEYCENPIRESWYTAIYHPFDTEPSFEGYLCDNCMDDVCWCESCERHIYENNGYRRNVRFDEILGTMICVKCLQEEWFDEGMPFFKDADWFDDSHLQKHGFVKHGSYFCRAKIDYKTAENEFVELQEKGLLVIISIEASGMGLEHHIAIWTKEVVD